jgi:hypothetical protein
MIVERGFWFGAWRFFGCGYQGAAVLDISLARIPLSRDSETRVTTLLLRGSSPLSCGIG